MNDNAENQNVVAMNEAVLPPLYARWISGLLEKPIPEETMATCHDCVMCRPGHDHGKTSEKAAFFDPVVKCCTYIPTLPNFLVGAILLDEDPRMSPGRQSVVERINKRIGVTPLTLEMPPEYRWLYSGMTPEAFGRVPPMRCPHYVDRDGGLCGIWRHRNSICSTWFCKYVRGQFGRDFWESMREMLVEMEKAVTFWAARRVGVNDHTLRRMISYSSGEEAGLSHHDLTAKVDDKDYQELWGDWHGRESEFYRRCAEQVARLEWPDVETIGGEYLQSWAAVVRADFAKLTDRTIPASLKLANFEVVELSGTGFRVVGYGANDPLEMSPALMSVLPYFDGSSTKEILVRVAREKDIEISPDLLLRLLEFGLVEDPRTQTPAPDAEFSPVG